MVALQISAKAPLGALPLDGGGPLVASSVHIQGQVAAGAVALDLLPPNMRPRKLNANGDVVEMTYAEVMQHALPMNR